MNWEIITGFRPGYLGRVAQMHGEYYAQAWGSGVAFEAIMAKELCEFSERYDPTRDLLLTAHIEGKLVGSIAVDGSQSERPGMARVRWFLLDTDYHGQGIGSELLRRALAFCKERDFPLAYLWTVEGLPQSLGLYERVGFRTIERVPDDRYSVPHMNLQMELPLIGAVR